MKERKFCFKCRTETVHVGLKAADTCVICESDSHDGVKRKIREELFVFDRLFKNTLNEFLK